MSAVGKTKTKKYRGSRTCGGGTHKNRRGKGSRGGCGWAGSQRHRSQLAREIGRAQGRYGFHRPPSTVVAVGTINVGAMDEALPRWVSLGVAKEAAGAFEVDLGALGYDKLLGTGKVTRKIKVSVERCSPSALAKIEEAGGTVSTEAQATGKVE